MSSAPLPSPVLFTPEPLPAQAKRRTAKGERTRAAILDAAERLFAERGYDGVSLRQIIEEAGVQMGQLQYYFPSKEGVFVSAVERRLPEVEALYAGAVADLAREAAAGQLALRHVVRAVMTVGRAWLAENDIGRHRYLRMLGLSTLSFNQPDYVAHHTRAFAPTNAIVMDWLARLYPGAAPSRIKAAYYFIEANLLGMYCNIDVVFARIGEPRNPASVARMHADLEDFLAGGVAGLLAQEAGLPVQEAGQPAG
ncbi:MAG TPA: TetR family transcriptional regulator [Novosphingobium sp.]|nr:TetR family transcriptional regulator [Novosphingobium sp.]